MLRADVARAADDADAHVPSVESDPLCPASHPKNVMFEPEVKPIIRERDGCASQRALNRLAPDGGQGHAGGDEVPADDGRGGGGGGVGRRRRLA